ncbi:JmjC-domain-containing protein [Saitoella complicata NRRL Y-17804]|uniref:JmjC-domain-containing protein n=1 Tax=Saitoella complicata (strain BCRC 22490 / CBS 7301 / JCM 7358 / NBRC 10748 / NRRL Y-17804) TaxID=698492 RepID=UPI0008681F75|nr:JmjC-domain-containing protein [Saitoella complicata NRRL Y-17804]ODQ53131.1 JmjC-domain-containing protein [Saitoella complicata NRRL Y-17804]
MEAPSAVPDTLMVTVQPESPIVNSTTIEGVTQPNQPASTTENAENPTETKKEEVKEEPILPDHYYGGGKVPVFKPTMDQFRSFPDFVRRINHYGMETGIVKVIPPAEWTAALPDLSQKVKSIRVRSPIEQNIVGSAGWFRQTNLEKRNSYSLVQWKKLCEGSEHQPPAKRGEKRAEGARRKSTRGVPREESEEKEEDATASTTPTRSSTAAAEELTPPMTAGQSERAVSSQAETKATSRPLTPPTPTTHGSFEEEEGPKITKGPGVNAARRARSAAHTDKAFADFDYRLSKEELASFTPERCEELERIYWKTLTYNDPLYGADLPGSLFEDSTEAWNVAKLDNILNRIGRVLPGVNSAYLYLGMWKASFAWHVEDMDLYSINYIHFGAPKQWYSISQHDLPRFEQVMKQHFPQDYKECPEFLRHKTFNVSPTVLAQNGIKVNKLVHNEGEFVITFPFGYHAGYNLGYNCAESVNFATEEWLEYGRLAKPCQCIPDAVMIDVDEIVESLKHGYDIRAPVPGEGEGRMTKRKRKAEGGEGGEGEGKKKLKIKFNVEKEEQCELCPAIVDWYVGDMLPVGESNKMVHRLCATYIPETYFTTGEDGIERVMGVENISKDRWKLKCGHCRRQKGACFQCANPKCVRAYHATCASQAGCLVESYEKDGEMIINVECKYHRPKRVAREYLENNTDIYDYARSLLLGDVVQIQLRKGDIFAGQVVENRHTEHSLVIDFGGISEPFEIEWKWVLAPPRRVNGVILQSPLPTPTFSPRKVKSVQVQPAAYSHAVPPMQLPYPGMGYMPMMAPPLPGTAPMGGPTPPVGMYGALPPMYYHMPPGQNPYMMYHQQPVPGAYGMPGAPAPVQTAPVTAPVQGQQ